jgi:hypothetical protein
MPIDDIETSVFVLNPNQFARLICGYGRLRQGTALTRNWNATHNGQVLIYLPAGGAARYFRPRSNTETEVNTACFGRSEWPSSSQFVLRPYQLGG